MNSILAIIDLIEKHPVTGTAVLALAVAGIIGIAKGIYNTARKRLIRESVHIDHVIWCRRRSFYITDVLEYIPSNDPSGYQQKQYSRPDLWKGIISIKTSFFGVRHDIVPVNARAVIAVMIMIKEKPKVMYFNRYE
jgi:hypothetical protein